MAFILSTPAGFRIGFTHARWLVAALAIAVAGLPRASLAQDVLPVRCASFFADFDRPDFGYPDLPAFDSPVFQDLARQVRHQIDRNRMFALLDLREYFPPELGRALWELLGSDSHARIYAFRELGLFSGRTNSGRPTYRPVTSEQRRLFSLLQHQERWFTQLLTEALGARISIPFVESEARLETAESNRRGQEWHFDGEAAGVRVALMVYGQTGTEVFLGPSETFIAPQGHALIIFGEQTQPDAMLTPILHRNPPGSGDRAVLFQTYSQSRDTAGKRPSSAPRR